MSSQFTIEVAENHLLATVKGVISVDTGKQFLRQILAACTEHGLNKVLIDAELIDDDLSIMTRFDLANFVVTEQNQPIRLAIIGPARMLTNGSVFEDVADNRGGVVKVTADRKEAYDWLMKT